MPFGVAKNGMRMYIASWQLQPGAAMKASNRASWERYNSTFSALNSNLTSATTQQSESMMTLVMENAAKRVQTEYKAKLNAAYSSLNSLDKSI